MRIKYTDVVKAMPGMKKHAWSWLDDAGMAVGNFLGGQDTALGRLVQPSLHDQTMHMYQQGAPQAEANRKEMANQYDQQLAKLDQQVSDNLAAHAAGKPYASLNTVSTGAGPRRVMIDPKKSIQDISRKQLERQATERNIAQMQQIRDQQDQQEATQRNYQQMAQQFAQQGMAPTLTEQQINQQNAVAQKQQELNKPDYQAFDKNNLANWSQDQINAINAAAQKNGINISDLRGVRFNDKGQVTGLRRVKQPTAQAAPPPTAQNPTALPPLQKGQGRIVQNGQVYQTPAKPAQQQRPPKGTIRATIGGTNYNMGANGNITRQ